MYDCSCEPKYAHKIISFMKDSITGDGNVRRCSLRYCRLTHGHMKEISAVASNIKVIDLSGNNAVTSPGWSYLASALDLLYFTLYVFFYS